MGLFEKIFRRPNRDPQIDGYFQLLNGYTPYFTTYDGGVYEMELTRSCIHTFANHASKLLPAVKGPDRKGVEKLLEGKPNFMMTSAQFLYKVATIYDAQNTCFIVPILDDLERLVGYYPIKSSSTELVLVNGAPWIRYTFEDGSKGAMELERCGTVSKYLYNNDLIGENNAALNPTMQLIDLQNQGIQEGIKNGANIRFFANISNFTKDEDLKKERQRFNEKNLGASEGGLLLFPNTYTNVTQVNSSPQIVDAKQMEIIQTRVYNYFGTNDDILQNKAVGDTWAAYYEGKIEPFAIQLSQAMTCMTYTENERSRGNEIVWSANRLQYMSNKDKATTSSQMFDRGVFCLNDIMDVWGLPHVEGGDKRYIRKEYIEISELDGAAPPEPTPSTEPPKEPEGGQINGNT